MDTSTLIPSYQLHEILHEGDDTVVYRATSQVDQQSVILKILKKEYPSLDAITRLKHEYQITQNLDSESVVKVLRLENHETRLAVAFEDFYGQSLKELLSSNKLQLNSFMSIAIQVTRALVSIHTHHIIHKDIKSDNIIINPKTGIVKLTDFSIASQLNKETPQLTNPKQLEGTLAYMSPEQTGRMNRTLDYRSDFYSLGVTFYEMLTGKLPFESDDPLELVYCHIARQPVDIKELNPDVPSAISAIVCKLMAKNAEDRYQTAKGLLADLELCSEQLRTTGKTTGFIPGRLDILSQLLIPQKLYGRETQVNSLLKAFERVSQGSRELILVSGYSGIGKSSVVNEINKPITRAKGFFISGKFDQFQRNIPYAPLIQAFSGLMRQLLTENTTQLEKWRSKILATVGSNGQVIIDVIPQVELIIGKQPQVVQLGAAESQNRFNRVFSEFIRVFTQKEHPLVIFLDDLQWADSATLKLMQLLITDPNSKYLLLIGAYRDNEVTPTHPLIQTVEQITKNNTISHNIILRSLSLKDVSQLVADTFNTSVGKVQILADLLYNKTGGNPFFLTQLLLVLYQEKLFKFNFKTGLWYWNIEEIQSIGITNKGIVELVASQIENLPQATQEILKLAACIGNQFSLNVLSIVNEKSHATTASELYYALQAGLILPLSDAYRIPLVFEQQDSVNLTFDAKNVAYKFLHDRVQQAAYSLIPDTQKQSTHLKIGQLLREQTPPESVIENILDIVNQLNFGLNLLTQQFQKDELAELNLLAGKKAKQATAYEAAAKYLNIGLELLSVDSWQKNYVSTLNLYVETTEAEYLTGNFDRANELVNIIVNQANNILDKVKIYEVKMLICTAQKKITEALEIGVEVLKELGVILPIKPTKLDVISSLVETKLTLLGKPIEKLASLPEMCEPYKLAAMQILLQIVPTASQAGSLLFGLSILAMVRLSVKYGRSPASAYAYTAYGSIISDKLGEFDTGYKFGKLGVDLISNMNANSLKATVHFVFNGTIRFFKDPLQDTIDSCLEGLQSGLEMGNIENAGYCAVIAGCNSLLSGKSLELVDKKLLAYIDLMHKLKLEAIAGAASVFRQTALNLQSRSSNKSALIGEAFDEKTMASDVIKNYSYKGFYYGCKAILAYLFNDYELAIENALIVEKTHADNAGFLIYIYNNFYYSLSLLALCNDHTYRNNKKYIKQVEFNQQKMKKLAKQAPCNFKHKYELVEAEKARVLGEVQVASNLYDRALAGAKENSYIQDAALINELAAKFYLGLGKEKIAKMYMTEAYYDYIHWGAIAKVKELNERYPHLIIHSENTQDSAIDATKTIVTKHYLESGINSNNILDLVTVIKALQAISSVIVLDQLLDTLLRIILENAAAQKGCLILVKDNDLFIKAINNTENSSVIVESTPIADSKDIPVSLVNYVARTREPLVLNDAISEDIAQSDPYIQQHQPKSILCTPIFYQGKFIGILYLENNLATNAFTSDRVTILNLITSQAAISLENSRLYQQAQDNAKRLEISLSDLQKMQLQLIQSEKMSALGNLVAGVAHEINNPLGFISGNLSEVKTGLQDIVDHLSLYRSSASDTKIAAHAKKVDISYLIEDLPNMIQSMEVGCDRIENISTSLRTFSRADKDHQVLFNIHEGIDSAILILKHRLKANDTRPVIDVVKEYGDLPQIHCFPGQLNQVFMNILANAIDALDESNEGRSFAEIEENPNRITIRTSVYEQEYVKIQIADNGIGMTEAVKEKIFDSLFTTKGVGKGTGLGLAIARQIIVEKHGGKIDVNSTRGQGTEFIITLTI
ncbi:trifunctional serine/threonine-protein kinase/ATP-binding protein/sensor histidine kinase [Aetokthonos hydrillicola Thurmond2011]|uniref:histidine kinase n=3 Tax=Aetokthonos TaxID=1550243 RepID=A0AAP5I8C8_9CYAN|nr:ATP-binding sensor histidine kinase [Aetokthonos hydrillicola]MBO3458900.1 AAA family ATPase [Aetokthonos hydrillicola CCALA 1050]MBW4587251.1 AAA family ATPase [Aetokthonos hydrillicola CCALA 1050]MDR9896726.1 trifunctional serine/threonine-protein kinase/ATP-binding protein/sensor histidine kinase [Aetokthonos hydrillicola Thurmond2011]